MGKLKNSFQCFLIILIFGYSYSMASSTGYFTAAVYEHARQEDKSPKTTVRTNLEYYQTATAEAKKQGADIIVFPEYGIFPPGERHENKRHLELIPNPQEVKANPCSQAGIYSDRPTLQFLSCMARKNRIVVVANMGGIEQCGGQPDCPEDGDLHMNANVAFDEDGTLIGRYYKERVFFEAGMDLPRQKQDPIFETGFGKFAMFTSFDILWQKMAVISRSADLDAVLFTSMWVNSFPFLMSTSWFQAFAIGNNATLVASNLQMPGYFAGGSGIFKGKEGEIASTFNPDGISKLVVAAIPRQNQKNLPESKIIAIYRNYTKPFEDDGKDLPLICAYRMLGLTKDIFNDTRCVNEDVSISTPYTLKKLENLSDDIEVCNNGICCELNYIANSMNESYYFGVYSGLHNAYDRYFWSEENCFLGRCDGFNGSACSIFPMKSRTVFRKIIMKANFKSKYIYPSLVGSRMRLVPTKMWTYEKEFNKASIKFNNGSGVRLLVASLKGRVYKKDPPYIR